MQESANRNTSFELINRKTLNDSTQSFPDNEEKAVCNVNHKFGQELYYSSVEGGLFILCTSATVIFNFFVILCIYKRRGRKAAIDCYLILLSLSHLMSGSVTQAFLARSSFIGIKTCTEFITASVFGSTSINISLLCINVIAYDRLKKIFRRSNSKLPEKYPWVPMMIIVVFGSGYAAINVFVVSLMLMPTLTLLTIIFYLLSVRKLKKLCNRVGSIYSKRAIPSH